MLKGAFLGNCFFSPMCISIDEILINFHQKPQVFPSIRKESNLKEYFETYFERAKWKITTKTENKVYKSVNPHNPCGRNKQETKP